MMGDFVVIHVAAASRCFSPCTSAERGAGSRRPDTVALLPQLLWHPFLPLSGVFPLIFALNGLYSTSADTRCATSTGLCCASAALATLV